MWKFKRKIYIAQQRRREKKNLLKKLDSPYSLALQFIEEIFKLAECEPKSRVVWNGQDNLRMAKACLQQCKRLGIKLLFHRFPSLFIIVEKHVPMLGDSLHILFDDGFYHLQFC